MPATTSARIAVLKTAHERALPLLLEAAKLLAPQRIEGFEQMIEHLESEHRGHESCQRVAARLATGLAYGQWD